MPTLIEMYAKDTACSNCGSVAWMIAYYKNSGGHETYPYVCVTCGHKSNNMAKKVDCTRLTLIELQPEEPRPTCEVCGRDGAELHHWAPRYYFGDKCDDWPTSYLCVPCHTKWHNTVTPEIVKRVFQRDSTEDYRQAKLNL